MPRADLGQEFLEKGILSPVALRHKEPGGPLKQFLSHSDHNRRACTKRNCFRNMQLESPGSGVCLELLYTEPEPQLRIPDVLYKTW